MRTLAFTPTVVVVTYYKHLGKGLLIIGLAFEVDCSSCLVEIAIRRAKVEGGKPSRKLLA